MTAPDEYRVLVVDDDEVDRMAVRRALRAAGVEADVHEAVDAPAGLRAIRAGGWDCVFLDFQLPGGDGLEVLRTVRAEGIHTPVVMLTGLGDPDTAVELMKSGAADFVTKGAFTPERLAQALRHAVRVHRAEDHARGAQAAMRASDERYRLVMRATNDVIWDWDLSTDELQWNEGLEVTFGYRLAEVPRVIQFWHDHVHADDRERVLHSIHAVIDGGGDRWADEYRFVRADGTAAAVLDRGIVARDAEGRPTRMIGSMQDITERKAAEEALRKSEERFRALHETSPDGFAILRSVRGADGQVQDMVYEYVNPAAARIIGVPLESLAGRRLLEVLPGSRAVGIFDQYVQVVESGQPMQTELEYEADGVHGWFRITAVPLHDGIAVGFADVSARRKAEADREAAVASRSRFYAAMSHELRTPINAILGYNDLILSGVYGDLAAKQQGALERAQRAARHLLDLVNDVLDLSKLEAGKVEVVAEQASIPDLVRDLFATVRPLAEEKGSDLRMVDDGTARAIVTDPRRVRQILLNLLSNALKFGRSRPVEVRVAGTADRGVAVEVVDQGEGIAPEHLGRVFEEFVQLPDTVRGGTGLGLPISRGLSELLGGRLEAESRPGEGSTFRLVLPRTLPGEPDAGSAAQLTQPAAFRS
ncbi:MAG TPA: ATP-binding protein [Longimicrobium sp.]|nr:ATP-binding protein [Longimicrobium sp.]